MRSVMQSSFRAGSVYRALLFACLVSCEQPQAYTEAGVVQSAPTYEERMSGAQRAVGTEALTSRSIELVENKAKWKDGNNTVLVDVVDKIGRIPEGVKTVDLMGDMTVAQLMLGIDQKAAAEHLYAQGHRLIVLHSQVSPSIDRDSKVNSRLYHHDHSEYFSLKVVGDGILI